MQSAPAAAAAAAVTVPASAASLLPLAFALLPSTVDRVLLTPQQNEQLCTALNSIQRALQRGAAADLLLLVELEQAAAVLQTLWPNTSARSITTYLLSGLEKLLWEDEHVNDASALRTRHGTNWSSLRALLATEEDRAFWTEQAWAEPNHIGSISRLCALPPLLERLRSRFPLPSDQHRCIAQSLSLTTTAPALEQLVLQRIQPCPDVTAVAAAAATAAAASSSSSLAAVPATLLLPAAAAPSPAVSPLLQPNVATVVVAKPPAAPFATATTVAAASSAAPTSKPISIPPSIDAKDNATSASSPRPRIRNSSAATTSNDDDDNNNCSRRSGEMQATTEQRERLARFRSDTLITLADTKATATKLEPTGRVSRSSSSSSIAANSLNEVKHEGIKRSSSDVAASAALAARAASAAASASSSSVAASSPALSTPLLSFKPDRLMWRYYFRAPLTCMLPFDQRIDVALGDPNGDPIVLIDPCASDKEAMARALYPRARDPAQYAQAWRMHFGCVNEGGHVDDAIATAKLPSEVEGPHRLWRAVPTEKVLTDHIEDDYAAALRKPPGQRQPVPASMQNRYYCKDVGERGGWAAKQQSKKKDNKKKGEKQNNKKKKNNKRKRAEELDEEEEEKEEESEEEEDEEPPSSFFPKFEDEFKEILETRERSDVDLKWGWLEALKREFYDHRADQRAFQTAIAARLEAAQSKGQHYLIHPLYLNELQLHRRSLVSLSWMDFDGVKDYYLYLKIGFQFFNLHIEQMIFTFIHHQLEGESLWFIIPHRHLDTLYELASEMYQTLYRVTAEALNLSNEDFERHCRVMGRALLYSKQLFPPLSLLKKHGIEYRRIVLGAGQVLAADGDCAHFGFSTRPGQTVSVASNMATERWIKRGLPFLVDYFTWMGELDCILQQHETAWRKLPPPPGQPSIHQLKSPFQLAGKSLNLCPINFACSFVRGLYADMDALRKGEEPVCEYPLLAAVADKKRLDQQLDDNMKSCTEIIKLLHQQRPVIKKMLKNDGGAKCTGCTDNKPDSVHQDSCTLCLCRGKGKDLMLPNTEQTEKTRQATQQQQSSSSSASVGSEVY